MKQREIKVSLFAIILFIFSSSCRSSNDELTKIEIPEAIRLSKADTIVRFNNKFPVSIDIKDSVLFIINYQDSLIFNTIDIFSKRVINEFGRYGNGPEDFYMPDFIVNNSIVNTNNDYLLVTDINNHKFLSIENRKNSEIDILPEYLEIFSSSSSINIEDELVVGRPISDPESMFFIYNRNSDSLNKIPFFPNIEGLEGMDKSLYLASNIVLNKKKNKIIAAFYFMDIINIYDVEGKKIKSMTFSKNSIPEIYTEQNSFDLRNGYIGYSFIFPTKEFIYLRRSITKVIIENNEPQEKKETYIVKIDWNGNVISNYGFNDLDIGRFCVNKENNKIYVIVNEDIDESQEHYYSILAYSI